MHAGATNLGEKRVWQKQGRDNEGSEQRDGETQSKTAHDRICTETETTDYVEHLLRHLETRLKEAAWITMVGPTSRLHHSHIYCPKTKTPLSYFHWFRQWLDEPIAWRNRSIQESADFRDDPEGTTDGIEPVPDGVNFCDGRVVELQVRRVLQDTARCQDARHDCMREETTRGEGCRQQLPASALQEQVREVRLGKETPDRLL